jgi:hypothetical protein
LVQIQRRPRSGLRLKAVDPNVDVRSFAPANRPESV